MLPGATDDLIGREQRQRVAVRSTARPPAACSPEQIGQDLVDLLHGDMMAHSSMSGNLILASNSPRRRDLLRLAGIPFEALASNIEERVGPGESPEQYVRRLAL